MEKRRYMLLKPQVAPPVLILMCLWEEAVNPTRWLAPHHGLPFYNMYMGFKAAKYQSTIYLVTLTMCMSISVQ